MSNKVKQSYKAKLKRKEQLRKLYKQKSNLVKQQIRTTKQLNTVTTKIKKLEPSTRFVKLSVHFSCCYDGIYYPEPLPVLLHETSNRGFRIKSLAVWRDMFLDSTKVRNYIEGLCNSKCQRAVGNNATMCEDGYTYDVEDWYEE